MKVQVKVFASLREKLGLATLEIDVRAGATVADLLDRLPELAADAALDTSALSVAVNRQFAARSVVLQQGDEVALLPPVSGGGDVAAPRLYEVTSEPLSLDEVAGRLRSPARGAVTVFAGLVRGETGEQQTDYLEYEAYAPMAEAVFAQIAAEIQARWPAIDAVAIVHRVGRLEVGEPSVIIAVAAGHRQETFEACGYAIERLKAIAPIWKKEVGSDGSYWVEGPRGEGAAAA